MIGYVVATFRLRPLGLHAEACGCCSNSRFLCYNYLKGGGVEKNNNISDCDRYYTLIFLHAKGSPGGACAKYPNNDPDADFSNTDKHQDCYSDGHAEKYASK